jgi:hypothetical protein
MLHVYLDMLHAYIIVLPKIDMFVPRVRKTIFCARMVYFSRYFLSYTVLCETLVHTHNISLYMRFFSKFLNFLKYVLYIPGAYAAL